MQNYYEVICKCGHAGSRQYYIPVAFPVKAENGKQASSIARRLPRVKHNHKDAILSCREISYEEYLDLNEINNNDPYLKCTNIQQQNQLDLSDRLVEDPHYFNRDRRKKIRHDVEAYLGKEAIRNVKYYVNNCLYDEDIYRLSMCY